MRPPRFARGTEIRLTELRNLGCYSSVEKLATTHICTNIHSNDPEYREPGRQSFSELILTRFSEHTSLNNRRYNRLFISNLFPKRTASLPASAPRRCERITATALPRRVAAKSLKHGDNNFRDSILLSTRGPDCPVSDRLRVCDRTRLDQRGIGDAVYWRGVASSRIKPSIDA